MIRLSATALACSALWAAPPSSAQTAAPAAATAPSAATARPDPLDTGASVPAALHSPALRTYRRLDDAQRLPWRDANELVERIGGWRAYAREAAAAALPASTAAPSPAAARPPAPAPASGHHHHHQP